MNQQELIDKMRKIRLWVKLTSYDQALYSELVSICQEKRWKEVFTCSNAKLCRVLSISLPTLIKCRENLIKAGLIFYQSGKTNRVTGFYSLNSPIEIIPKKKISRVTTEGDTVLVKGDFPVTTKGGLDYLSIYIYNNTPPNPLKGEECVRETKKIKISFNETKEKLLADKTWSERTSMHSGFSKDQPGILPAQIDIFLQFIGATGDEHTIQTLQDAKRRFFWWWKNYGRKEYEEERERERY